MSRTVKKVKLRSTAKDGIVFVHTDGMKPMAKKARQHLKELGVPNITLCELELRRFESSEVKPKVLGNVRGGRVYLFYDFRPGTPNDDIMNLYLILDALHLADASDITLVVPYLPYLRQDRKDESRTPISAKRILKGLESTSSLKRIITFDMHADQLQSVFDIPSDHLPGRIVVAPWIKQCFGDQMDDVVFVSPDSGSVKRVGKLAEMFGFDEEDTAYIGKKRGRAGVKMLSLSGADVNGKTCIINDDMIDTGGTIIKASKILFERGAKRVILSATHAVFSPSKDDEKDGEVTSAYEKFARAGVEVVVTDSRQTEKHPWLTVLPLAKFVAYTILQQVARDGSVSKLIEEGLPHD
ncbi:MAG: ribose-phosphate pyrophosphokinase [Candidatus Kaiserbacteria bacterium]|nr:ribose-phosphate pyrophosphokinase [Candidatus Kaiserbacteria bacterium]MCB9816633.1 ribose-phosphate pyrophosphokinase [Candidatus Nomurabacteria bacterium]